MFAFPLSEKTLELNVLENMVEDIRKKINPRAYLYGFSLRYERFTGLDSSLSVPSNPLLLAFQFKKCVKTLGSIYVFYFNNNKYHDQHNFLYFLAISCRPSFVFYALPAIADMTQFSNVAPNFKNATYLVDPADIGPLFDWRRHEIHLNPFTNTCSVFSEAFKKEIKARKWDEILNLVDAKEVGIRVEDFVESLRKERRVDVGIKIAKPDQKRRILLRSLMMPI